jgi:F0F1-type ATP synthase delta subunit
MGWIEIAMVLALFAACGTGIVFLLHSISANDFQKAVRRMKEVKEEAITKENEIKEEFARARKESQAEIEKCKTQAAKLIEEAKETIAQMRQAEESAAHEERARIIDSAHKEVVRLKSNMQAEAATAAVAAGVDLIKKMFAEPTLAAFHEVFSDELIAAVALVDQSSFTVRSRVVKVASARPLDDARLAKLTAILVQKVAPDAVLETSVDPSLVAGITIAMGEFVIDGSVKNKLQRLVPLLK